MAQQTAPYEQFEFHGVHTAGHPLGRPRGTASVCKDFRVMPGFWLRTRGGRKWRAAVPDSGEVQQIFRFRDMGAWGSANQLAQVKYAGPTVKLHWFSLLSYVMDPFNLETVSLANDSAWAAAHPVAIANLDDRPVMYNGLGVRGADSKPPFSTFDGSQWRYFGLDAYCPSGNPSASYAGGAGSNKVASSVEIWVGLYHAPTEHYSNAVYAGTITATGGTGTITVSNLTKLVPAYHNVGEQAELSWVFYATIDGLNTPYLIQNVSQDGPHTVPVFGGATSGSLSIAAGTDNGWNLDLTKEAPQENFPPRPMRSIWYTNGRLYGVPLSGGSGNSIPQRGRGPNPTVRPDFSYIHDDRQKTAVVWSRTAGDVSETDLLGDPLQCWPLQNEAYTFNFEQPIAGCPAQDGRSSLVLTSTGAFLLEEQADGIHEFRPVSLVHGIAEPATLKTTPYGIVWVDQRNQIVILPMGSERVTILSGPYQSLMSTPRCADYLLDPANEIDRYEVFLTNSTSVCHDFAIGGEGYSSTNRDYTAALSVVDNSGKQHHIVAKNAYFTQEAQPEDGLILTTDANADGTVTQISGEYERNWDAFSDPNVRKELPSVYLIGDGAASTALSNASPLSVEWYADLEAVSAPNKKTLALTKTAQSDTDWSYAGKLVNGIRFWYKFVLKAAGHSTDAAAFQKHMAPGSLGRATAGFYGSVLAFFASVSRTKENRV